MNMQILVATMNQSDYTLLNKMNIISDAIVVNQCDENRFVEFDYNGNSIKWMNLKEIGVGLNRNNSLMRATADICLFADDDIVYDKDCEKLVLRAFNENPKADVLIFNLYDKTNQNRKMINKVVKVHWLNYLRYGTARVAIKLESVRFNGILFNQCFGGGAKYCHGEDNLFLTDCLRKNLKVYAVPYNIGVLTDERESSWNKGYDEKYFNDQGVLYYAISKKLWKFLCLQDSIRHAKEYNRKWYDTYKLMIKWKKN